MLLPLGGEGVAGSPTPPQPVPVLLCCPEEIQGLLSGPWSQFFWLPQAVRGPVEASLLHPHYLTPDTCWGHLSYTLPSGLPHLLSLDQG